MFLAPGDVGKGRVEPISWMQTCNAYAERGLDVTLVTMRTKRPDAVARAEIWQHFGLKPSFRIVEVPTGLRHDSGVAWFRLWAGLVSSSFALRALARNVARNRPLLVHVRQPVHAVPFLLLRPMVPKRRRPTLVLETHVLPKAEHAWVFRRVDIVVTNSSKLADDMRRLFGIDALRVVHAPLGPYNQIRPRPKADARAAVGLDSSKPIAAYVGKLTEELVDFLLSTAQVIARNVDDFELLIVGGNPRILAWTKSRIDELSIRDHVVLAGFVQPASVELYQAAADVLLFHVPESFGTFEYCTPSKGYEYQAARRPIVATDIPLFEEEFGEDGERAIRVREHTPEAFAAGILAALSLEDNGAAMTERAARWIKKRTWHARVDEILSAISTAR